MAYLTYDDYKEMGGTATEAHFNNLLARATIRIDYVTQHRITEDNKPAELKQLAFDLIGIYATGIETRDPSLTSYSNGIESFGYAVGSAGSVNLDSKVNSLICEYLSAYPELLYRGVRV